MTVYSSRKCLSANSFQLNWHYFKGKVANYFVSSRTTSFETEPHVDTHHVDKDHHELLIFLTLSQVLGLQTPNSKPGFMRCQGHKQAGAALEAGTLVAMLRTHFRLIAFKRKQVWKKIHRNTKEHASFLICSGTKSLAWKQSLGFLKAKRSHNI